MEEAVSERDSSEDEEKFIVIRTKIMGRMIKNKELELNSEKTSIWNRKRNRSGKEGASRRGDETRTCLIQSYMSPWGT